ncbi:MAG: hemin uptake protein HemP [Proteobacteria bacterium]|nr:hemin uptake protein HemP [Pseudomonadota bacterium]
MNPVEQSPILKKYSSEALFQDDKEVIIEHDSQQYRLRITSNGKLILTK